jgi:hypothetical protein
MHPSNFQAGLSTLLALGLGGALATVFSNRSAMGYPGGAMVSYGGDPVVSAGGSVGDTTTTTLFTAPADQDIVITDMVLTVNDTNVYCTTSYTASLVTDAGATLGTTSVGLSRQPQGGGYAAGSYSRYHPFVPIQMHSGVRVPAGQSVDLSVTRRMENNCDSPQMHYLVSGTYVQP